MTTPVRWRLLSTSAIGRAVVVRDEGGLEFGRADAVAQAMLVARLRAAAVQGRECLARYRLTSPSESAKILMA